MNIRILYNYILVRIGIRSILPAEIIRRKKVKDNQEALVPLTTSAIVFADGVKDQKTRQGIAIKLERIAERVQVQGYKLLIYELYRDPKKQLQKREEYTASLKILHPELSEEEIMRTVNKGVANVGGGHQTGGAVDLTLCDKNGTPIDMGNDYLVFREETRTDSKKITPLQRKNRELLIRAMQSEDFVNYPAEWWHFSYGDKMWAAYSNKPFAIYDVVTSTIVQ